jgi:putative transposase
MANLGYGNQTVGNVLPRNGLPPAPEVLTLRGVVTYYVLFFIHLESHRAWQQSTRFNSLERTLASKF